MGISFKGGEQLRGYLFTKLYTNLSSTVNFILAITLLVGGIFKIYDASGVISVLNQLSFLNETAIALTATILPIIELGLGIALLLKWQPFFTFKFIATLFAIFLGFSIYGMAMNLQGDCG